MSKFTSSAPLNMRWLGNEINGAAGVTHRIPDALYEEFIAAYGSIIPGLTWVDTDELDPAPLGVDGGIITGAVTASQMFFKGQPWYDVKAYGALGNNTGNDATAIQAAIDAAEAAGTGTIYFPAGTYRVTTGITMEAIGLRLVGAGIYNTKIRAVFATAGPIISIGHSAGTQLEGMGVRDIEIAGDSNCTYGIYMRHAAVYGEIERVLIREITGSPGAGIGQSDASGDEHWTWTYRGSIFRNNNIGLMLRRKWQHTVVDDCVFTANDVYGIDAAGNPTDTNGGKLFIQNGTIERNGRSADTTGGIYLRGVNLVTIRSIYGESNSDFPGFFICVDQDSASEASSEVLAEGCYWTGSSQATKGIILKHGRAVTIRNNRFRNATTAIISYEPGSLTGVKVYDNTYTDAADASAQRRELPIPIAGFLTETGSPAAVAWPATGNTYERMYAVAFDQTTNEGIQVPAIVIPDDFMPSTTMSVHYIWSSDLTTGSVVWQAFTKVVSASEGASGASDLESSRTEAMVSTQYGLVTSRIGVSSTITVSPGDIVRIGIRRQAANGGDTLAGDAYLIGVFLSRKD